LKTMNLTEVSFRTILRIRSKVWVETRLVRIPPIVISPSTPS
jgi:hypothetical protein